MSVFTLYFGGAEQQGWRKILAEQGAPMSVSFRGLLRRMPKTKPWLMAERMAGEYPVLLDSGAHSFNTKQDATVGELESFAATYEGFVEANADRPTLISEFDSTQLGLQWVQARRREFYDHLEPSKFMPVWHAEWGVNELRAMADKYEVIALTATESVQGTNITPTLQQISRSGVRLHGVALTKPDVLRTLPLSSAASTSWLSPSQYGDTIVWDGQQLHRYPKDYRERARRQHRMLFERAGFDPDKIEADDTTEVLRFTVWSWLQQAAAIQTMRRRMSGQTTVSSETTVSNDGHEEAQILQMPTTQTVVHPSRSNNEAAPPEKRGYAEREERLVLPGIGVKTLTSTDVDSEGKPTGQDIALFEVKSTSSRNCDHCFIADVCKMYRPGHVCAYDIPVSAETAEQRKAIMRGVIEMQTQRVAFLKLVEDEHGGYADPNLSGEIDRLQKLMLAQHEIEDDRDSFEMTVRARGSRATMMERIFGEEPPPRHGTVIDVDPVVATDPLRAIEDKVPLH